MFITIHAATGVIIGQTISSPLLAFLYGLVFHFVLDMIPHGDKHLIRHKVRKTRIKMMLSIASIDAVIMGLFLTFIFNYNLGLNMLPIAFGVVGSIIPDLIVGIGELANGKVKLLKKFYNFHLQLHYFPLFENFDPKLKTGMIMQLFILAFLTGLIL